MLARAQRQRRKQEVLPLGVLIQVLLNVHRDTDVRPEPFDITEILRWLGFPDETVPQAEAPSADDLLERARLLHDFYMATNGHQEES